jgi:hypothetical protein
MIVITKYSDLNFEIFLYNLLITFILSSILYFWLQRHVFG